MATLDPTKLADWQIAEEGEKNMKTVKQLADELGIQDEELIPHGHYYGKVDFEAVLERQFCFDQLFSKISGMATSDRVYGSRGLGLWIALP